MNSGCCRGRPPFPLNADFFFFSFSSPLSGASWFSHTPNPVWVSYHGKNPRHLQTSRSFAGGPTYCHVRTRGHIPSPFPVAACPVLQSPLLSAPGCRPLMAPVTPLWASASGEASDYKLPLLLLQLPVVFSADLFGLKRVDPLTDPFPSASSNAPAIPGLSCFIVVFIPRLLKIITVPTRVNVSPPPTTTVLAGSAA